MREGEGEKEMEKGTVREERHRNRKRGLYTGKSKRSIKRFFEGEKERERKVGSTYYNFFDNNLFKKNTFHKMLKYYF